MVSNTNAVRDGSKDSRSPPPFSPKHFNKAQRALIAIYLRPHVEALAKHFNRQEGEVKSWMSNLERGPQNWLKHVFINLKVPRPPELNQGVYFSESQRDALRDNLRPYTQVLAFMLGESDRRVKWWLWNPEQIPLYTWRMIIHQLFGTVIAPDPEDIFMTLKQQGFLDVDKFDAKVFAAYRYLGPATGLSDSELAARRAFSEQDGVDMTPYPFDEGEYKVPIGGCLADLFTSKFGLDRQESTWYHEVAERIGAPNKHVRSWVWNNYGVPFSVIYMSALEFIGVTLSPGGANWAHELNFPFTETDVRHEVKKTKGKKRRKHSQKRHIPHVLKDADKPGANKPPPSSGRHIPHVRDDSRDQSVRRHS